MGEPGRRNHVSAIAQPLCTARYRTVHEPYDSTNARLRLLMVFSIGLWERLDWSLASMATKSDQIDRRFHFAVSAAWIDCPVWSLCSPSMFSLVLGHKIFSYTGQVSQDKLRACFKIWLFYGSCMVLYQVVAQSRSCDFASQALMFLIFSVQHWKIGRSLGTRLVRL